MKLGHLAMKIPLPMAQFFSKEQVKTLLVVILENGQIYAAAGTSAILVSFVKKLSERSDTDFVEGIEWEDFITSLHGQYDNYEGLALVMGELGFIAPRDWA